MLDTGIDVPEVVDLVLFKLLRSKTKFWQMIGRGTRLCVEMFGPGQDKTEFRVIDCCGNLEFFGANPELKDERSGCLLKERLFAARLDIVCAIDQRQDAELSGVEEDGPPFEASADAPPRDERGVRRSALAACRTTLRG